MTAIALTVKRIELEIEDYQSQIDNIRNMINNRKSLAGDDGHFNVVLEENIIELQNIINVLTNTISSLNSLHYKKDS